MTCVSIFITLVFAESMSITRITINTFSIVAQKQAAFAAVQSEVIKGVAAEGWVFGEGTVLQIG